MTVWIHRTALAAFLGGQACLLVQDGLPGQEALAELGLGLWLLRPGDGGLHVLPAGAPAADALVPLPGVPAQLVAVVVADAAPGAAFEAWWSAHAPGNPPMVVAESAAAALPALLRQAAERLRETAVQAARGQQALVAMRQDAEQNRSALAAMLRSAGVSRPMEPEPLLAAEPLPGVSAGPRDGVLLLRQTLNVMLEGVTAVALHVALATLGAGGVLRVRLIGAESDRAFGAWQVPAAALRPGWLMLDLPTPLGPVRETAVLELATLLEPDEELRFSLEDALADPVRAVEGHPSIPARALAVQAWTAPPGRRCVLSPYWDWDVAEQVLTPPGIAMTMPREVWAAARLPEQASMVALGLGAPRPILSLASGETALATLPWVPVRGHDLLEAEVIARSPAAEEVEAALWLLPAGSQPERPGELALDAPGARWSGWQPLPAGRPVLTIRLRLPPRVPPMVCTVLVLRRSLGAPEPCRVEWAELAARRLEDPPPEPAEMSEATPLSALR